MEHEALLRYLNEQLAERDAFLAKFEEAKAHAEEAKVVYEEAVRAVQNFGNVTKVQADKEYVQALIAQYSVQPEAVDVAVADGVAVDPATV